MKVSPFVYFYRMVIQSWLSN